MMDILLQSILALGEGRFICQIGDLGDGRLSGFVSYREGVLSLEVDGPISSATCNMHNLSWILWGEGGRDLLIVVMGGLGTQVGLTRISCR